MPTTPATTRLRTLTRCVGFITGLLILKVTASIVLGYRGYFPPDFNVDFLRGREAYFFGDYQRAFYTHIVGGPFTLVIGMLLISEQFRRRWPVWHRRLGRVQVANVLLLVAPSGLWMAYYTSTGRVAGVGFAILSVLTAGCTALGWRAAVQRRFLIHRRWMWRSFLLLCSAVLLRVLGGLGTTLGVESLWYDPAVSWISWLAPLAVFECLELIRRLTRSNTRQPSTTSIAPASVAES
jgi:hypothetical protein